MLAKRRGLFNFAIDEHQVHYGGKHALQFEATQSAGMDLRANIDAPVVLQLATAPSFLRASK